MGIGSLIWKLIAYEDRDEDEEREARKEDARLREQARRDFRGGPNEEEYTIGRKSSNPYEEDPQPSHMYDWD